MAAYQAGNEAAFDQLFERYGKHVYAFLVRHLEDPSLAEDLYQEAFLRVHRARSTYDSTRPFRAWLFGIVHNLAVDAVRSRRRVPHSERRADVLGDAPATEFDAIPPATQAPERAVALGEASRELSRALEALPSEEATVLILARVEGRSYEDIGRELGRTAAATKQLAYRALKRIRAWMVLAGHGDDT